MTSTDTREFSVSRLANALPAVPPKHRAIQIQLADQMGSNQVLTAYNDEIICLVQLVERSEDFCRCPERDECEKKA